MIRLILHGEWLQSNPIAELKIAHAKVNHFAIPAVPDRAIAFYEEVFGWRFEVGWEYDTRQGREKYWRVITGVGGSSITGGLTRRDYPGQPISIGIEVSFVDADTDVVEKTVGKY